MRPEIIAKLKQNLLPQVQEITAAVKTMLPAFVVHNKDKKYRYHDLLLQINAYAASLTELRKKSKAIRFCIRWVEIYGSQSNTWEASLYSSLMQIDQDTRDYFTKKIYKREEDKNNFDQKYAILNTWMQTFFEKMKTFLPDNQIDHATNVCGYTIHSKTNNWNANYAEPKNILIAGSGFDPHQLSKLNEFKNWIIDQNIVVIVAAGTGATASDPKDFCPYWMANPEKSATSQSNYNVPVHQINIANGGAINLKTEDLLEVIEIFRYYIKFKRKFTDATSKFSWETFVTKTDAIEIKITMIPLPCRMLVHCRGGKGRTGSFNFLMLLLEDLYNAMTEAANNADKVLMEGMNKLLSGELIDKEKNDLIKKMFEVVVNLRKNRPAAIETPAQINFAISNVLLLWFVLTSADRESLEADIDILRNLLEMDKIPNLPPTPIIKHNMVFSPPPKVIIIRYLGKIFAEKNPYKPETQEKINLFSKKVSACLTDFAVVDFRNLEELHQRLICFVKEIDDFIVWLKNANFGDRNVAPTLWEKTPSLSPEKQLECKLSAWLSVTAKEINREFKLICQDYQIDTSAATDYTPSHELGTTPVSLRS